MQLKTGTDLTLSFDSIGCILYSKIFNRLNRLNYKIFSSNVMRECHAFSNKNYYQCTKCKALWHKSIALLFFFLSLSLRFGQRCDKFHHHFIYHPRFSILERTNFIVAIFRWKLKSNFCMNTKKKKKEKHSRQVSMCVCMSVFNQISIDFSLDNEHHFWWKFHIL